MKFDKIHNKGQARIFRSGQLEMLTKTHPLVILGLYLPLVVLLPLKGIFQLGYSYVPAAVIFLSGMAIWTLFEYLIHRFAFHHIANSPRAKRIIYIIHANHHEYPRDRERLFMPPVPSLFLAAVFFVVQFLLLQDAAYLFFPGFLFGYLLYGSMHYAIHAWKPPFKWMKPLWRNHHLHHYREQGKGFGVSTTFWDRVFGTMFDLSGEREDKKKVKDLMFE
jgi:sterol desaturase/sphingolipid hydroxylase (fatty acid hydroxylase superfamily)